METTTDMPAAGKRIAAKDRPVWRYLPGIAFILLGVLAIAEAGLASLVAGFYLAVLLSLAGGFGIATGAAALGREGAWLPLLLGIVSLVAGIFLLFDPVLGAVALVRLIGMWFILAGLCELTVAFASRSGRLWLIFIALVDLVVGGYLVLLHPARAFLLLGYLFGISFLIRGLWNILFLGGNAPRDGPSRHPSREE